MIASLLRLMKNAKTVVVNQSGYGRRGKRMIAFRKDVVNQVACTNRSVQLSFLGFGSRQRMNPNDKTLTLTSQRRFGIMPNAASHLHLTSDGINCDECNHCQHRSELFI